MKYTITHVAEWILLAILAILCIYTAYKSYQIKEKVEYITVTDTIKLNDTIVDMKYDTCYLWKKDTVKLPVVINDTTTLIKIDSILVEIPKYKYYYDTIIKDTAYSTRFSAVMEGFDVVLDSVYLNTVIAPQKAKKEPWYNNIGVGVGIMYGSGGAGVGVGLMYKL